MREDVLVLGDYSLMVEAFSVRGQSGGLGGFGFWGGWFMELTIMQTMSMLLL